MGRLFLSPKFYASRVFMKYFLILCLIVCRPVLAQELGTRLLPSQVERITDEKEAISTPFAGLIVTPRNPQTVADDKYNQKYPAACFVYIEEKAGGSVTGYARRFVVHAPDNGALPTAKRVAKLLLWFHGMTRERLKTEHDRSLPTMHVWLTRSPGAGLSADVGGEQFKNQIYIYDIFAERKPMEWVREIAHEYGHYALPGVIGFTAPEEWSNGVLGERLYLKWLADEIKTGRIPAENLPFITPAELDEFQARQIVPLISRWANQADWKRLTRTDAAGMDDYTGLILYWDAVHGSAAVRDVFAASSSSANNTYLTAPDVGQGAMNSLKDAEKFSVISPLKDKTAPFAAYFPFAAWSIETKNVKTWQILTEGKNQITRNKADIFVKVRGWYKVKLMPENDKLPSSLTVKRIYTK